MYELFPRLKEREKQSAGTLSGGEQQMLALGRAIMSKPRLLMIDEPSLGLAPVLSQGVLSKLTEINQTRGQTILLIEQNARAALSIADYAYPKPDGSPGRTRVSWQRTTRCARPIWVFVKHEPPFKFSHPCHDSDSRSALRLCKSRAAKSRT